MTESDAPPGGAGQRLSRLRSVVRWLAVGAIFFFIGRSLVRNWDELAAADLHFDIWLLLASFVLLGLWMVAQAIIWHLLTVSSGAHIPLPKAMAAWFYSQLGKYVPGKLFLYLGRVHLYAREGAAPDRSRWRSAWSLWEISRPPYSPSSSLPSHRTSLPSTSIGGCCR